MPRLTPSIKRLRRWLFNLLLATSLLLLLTTIILWVRSYHAMEIWDFNLSQFGDPTADNRLNIITGKGGLSIELTAWEIGNSRLIGPPLSLPIQTHRTLPPAWPDEYFAFPEDLHGISFPKFKLLSYRHFMSFYSITIVQHYILAPLWAWTLPSTAAPLLYLTLIRKRRRNQKRISNGQCPTCGYDLRATPERCPECGSIPISTASTKHSF